VNSRRKDTENIGRIFEEVANIAELNQRETLQHAEKFGYIAHAARSIGATYESTYFSDISTPDQEYLRQNAIAVGGFLKDTIGSITPYVYETSKSVDEALQVFAVTSTTADTTCNIFLEGPARSEIEPCPFLSKSDAKACEEKLALLDGPLAGVYRSAWHNLYADNFDPGRGALWQLRQVYDHFFELLAPAEQVVQSSFWAPKSDPPFEAIHRAERVQYAANRWIANESQRKALQESDKSMLRAYNKLNQAHERGEIDLEKARRAFKNMDAMLRNWIDGIQEWPPNFQD
jgi:hypothetical protein